MPSLIQYLDDHCVKLNHHDEQSIIGLRYRLAFSLSEGGYNAIIRDLCKHMESFDSIGETEATESSQLGKGFENLMVFNQECPPSTSATVGIFGLPLIAPGLKLVYVVLKLWYPLMACIANSLCDHWITSDRFHGIDVRRTDAAAKQANRSHES